MPHIKIGLVRVLSVIYKTLHKNFTLNMYYVNVKIKKKTTIGLAKRIVIFLHCSFQVKVSGRVQSRESSSMNGYIIHP